MDKPAMPEHWQQMREAAASVTKDDYFKQQEITIARTLIEQLQAVSEKGAAFDLAPAISEEEWWGAKASPHCIVEHWFYEDVGVFVAPGGTGKTTLILFQAVHIVLGMELFGHAVLNPGPVLILTAEDSRESLVARLRFICSQLYLSDDDIAKVRSEVIITDVSGKGFKLTTVERDTVVPSRMVERLIKSASELHPALVVIDPAVSFGVGESRVNDAEQGLVDAGRRLRNELQCAVIYVHHTGKANGREKTLDQYSGRGGSAFADGSRMVHVLQSATAQDWLAATGDELQEGEFGFVLARPKISHAPPQPNVYLKRKGHLFTRYEYSHDESAALDANAEKVWQFLNDEINEGRKYSGRKLEAKKLLPQKATREAIALLKEEGRLSEDKSADAGRGGARTYLRPIASFDHS
ncbi:hypothetical protein QWA_06590 [Alcaligenes faecalis subsp. faecalis NCIB 8687]|nr:hypothetical protein QWA_06590 [Alcaligenes faecalis subsp. faecalis NCIB 8687]